MIEVVLNDRLGKKVSIRPAACMLTHARGGTHLGDSAPPTPLPGLAQIRVKCNEDDTIGDLKKLVAAQTGECHL